MEVSQYVLVLFNRNKFAQLITVVTLRVEVIRQLNSGPDWAYFTVHICKCLLCFARLGYIYIYIFL